MTLSSLLAMVILLRILFTIKEFGNDDAYSLEPMTKQQLRGFQANIIAYEKFNQIYKNVIMASATGGSEHKYKLCHMDQKIINIIDEMVREAFPDSLIHQEASQFINCTSYKIIW